jgi:hypothetical protein
MVVSWKGGARRLKLRRRACKPYRGGEGLGWGEQFWTVKDNWITKQVIRYLERDGRETTRKCPGQVHFEHHAIRDKWHYERSEAISHT